MTNKSKHMMSVEDTIVSVVSLFQKGAAPKVIASVLLVDGFSEQQTETIMRWAYLKVKKQKQQTTE